MIRKSIDAFASETAANELSTMTPDQIIALVETASMVTRYAAAAREAAKTLVTKNGDVVGSRQRLTLSATTHRELHPIEGLLALQRAGFDDDDLGQVMTLSVSKAEKVVKSKAPHGKGAAAIRVLGDTLELAGVVTKKQRQRLVIKRAEGQE